MRDRNRQKQLWSDKEFIERLERIKAQRLLSGNPVNSLAELTKEIVKAKSFEELEKELLGIINKSDIKIRMDRKRL